MTTLSPLTDVVKDWWPVAAVVSVAAIAGGAILVAARPKLELNELAAGRVPRRDPGLVALDRVLHEGVRDDELDYLRSGMRPLVLFRKAFTDARILGISPTHLATSGRYFGQESLPIRIDVMPDGQLHLSDGRHRYTVAKEMGARAILARVVLYDADANVRMERLAEVRLL